MPQTYSSSLSSTVGEMLANDRSPIEIMDVEEVCEDQELNVSFLLEEFQAPTPLYQQNTNDLRFTADQMEIWRKKLETCEKEMAKFQDFMEKRSFLFTLDGKELENHPQLGEVFPSIKDPNVEFAKVNEDIEEVYLSGDDVEIIDIKETVPTKQQCLPPVGVLKRTKIAMGDRVWAMKENLTGVFEMATVIGSRGTDAECQVKVRFYTGNVCKYLKITQVAFIISCNVIIPVGTRIIGRYTEGYTSAMYAGVIAEPPKKTNMYRYLVFFDDGYTQYMNHQDIHVMCSQSPNVHEDVHEGISAFIRDYIAKYPERAMVKFQKSQVTRVEFESKWFTTKVLAVDSSLVLMQFIDSHRTEWLYRGSTRLKELFQELKFAEETGRSGRRRHGVSRKADAPFVQYTRDDRYISISDEMTSTSDEDVSSASVKSNEQETKKNVAKKSTGKRGRKKAAAPVLARPISKVSPDLASGLGTRETIAIYGKVKSHTHRRHSCSVLCKEFDTLKKRSRNPLLLPIQ